MQRRGLFRGMLVVGILANLGVIILFASEKKETGLIESWKPYTSKDIGCSLTYPEGWRVAEFNRHDVEYEARFYCTKSAYMSAVGSLTGGLMMEITKSVSRNPLRDYHEKFVAGLEEGLGHFNRTEAAEMKVGGMEAYCTSFEFRTWNGLMGRTMKGMVVSTWNGDQHIAFWLVSPEREYEQMFDAFGTFLNSFKSERTRD